MKKILSITFCLGLLLSIHVLAQDKSKRPSPPAQATATIDGVKVTIDYSQPALKGRDFGSDAFCPYGDVWRNGANEATWIEVSADVKIQGETLPQGKYAFFAIPGEKEWTLIFNNDHGQWGAFNYDEAKDVLRVKASSQASSESMERYTIKLSKSGDGSLNWGDWMVPFTVKKG